MVKLDNISFAYSRKNQLISQLSLDIPAGSIHGLLGKNGAGKTTLLKLICGLRHAQLGKIDVQGYEPSKRSQEFNASYYFVPEEIYAPSISAALYLKLYSGYYPQFNKEMFLKYLQDFDLDMNMHLGKSSYGQKKKFLLSFAMATSTPLVLFDEPTNGLDIPSKSTFRKLAASAINENRCFIISTHQVRDLNLLLDSVIILNKGKILLNSSIFNIANRYSFINLKRNQPEDKLIYSEEHIEGIKAIVESDGETETGVDLEMLFNAATLGHINLQENKAQL